MENVCTAVLSLSPSITVWFVLTECVVFALRSYVMPLSYNISILDWHIRGKAP